MPHPVISKDDFLGMSGALAKFFAQNKAYMSSLVFYARRTSMHAQAFETYWVQQSHDVVFSNYICLPEEMIRKSKVSKDMQDFVLTNRVCTKQNAKSSVISVEDILSVEVPH